ncbi:MAG TPA: alpha/beta fold hydrolase [Streptosporangiaceae bacterium]|nr:alpha/beta fold hydrolase [Streptosporangiaceae bacterium]
MAGQGDPTAAPRRPGGSLWLRPASPVPDQRPDPDTGQAIATDASSGTDLICFPHAGGSASYYFPLLAPLAARMDVYVVQYPGRHDRRHEPPIPSIAALADQVAAAIPAAPGRRLALFGHSMGALVAFEVALRLRRSSHAVAHLFASARRAPSSIGAELLHHRPDEEIAAELHRLGGGPHDPAVQRTLMRLVMPALRNDLRAAETYVPRPGQSVSCPVTALTGAADPRTSLDDARAWAQATTGDFFLRVFPGGHFYLNERASQLTDVIWQQLSAAPAG